MPKQTRKYVSAVNLAIKLDIVEHDDQETLYRLLNESGYFWDSETQVWQESIADPDPPTEVIRVRVWAESSVVSEVVRQLRMAFEEMNYHFLEQSQSYPCRPPKQLELRRVYLTFIKY